MKASLKNTFCIYLRPSPFTKTELDFLKDFSLLSVALGFHYLYSSFLVFYPLRKGLRSETPSDQEVFHLL